jgi:protein SCO1/2
MGAEDHKPGSTTVRNSRLRRLQQPVAMLLFLVLTATLAGGCSDDEPDGDAGPFVRVGDSDPNYRGVFVVPPPEKPDAVLTDTDGAPFDLRADTEGYVTLLFFGYTHCPDVCPTQMLSIATALGRLEPGVAARVKVVFVTTDPERDTPDVLREWLASFDSSFVGLIAEPSDLDRLQEESGMAAASSHVDGPNTAATHSHGDGHDDYAVVHGEFVLAFTAGDNLAHLVFPLDATAETFAHDIEKLVTEGWTE